MKSFEKEFCEQNHGMKIIMKLIFFIALAALIWYLIIPRSIFFFHKAIYIPIIGGLNTYDVVLTVGDSYHLYIFGVNKRVSFQSSDIKVATVNILGTVKAWRPGTTIVKVRYEDKVLRCRVRVVDLNKKKMSLHIGESSRLKVKHILYGAKYSSSDSQVATVSRYGTVKAKKKGTVTITVTYRGKKMKCKVVVKE